MNLPRLTGLVDLLSPLEKAFQTNKVQSVVHGMTTVSPETATCCVIALAPTQVHAVHATLHVTGLPA
jgi:uncharacterized ParB-like nuclease family protein